MNPGMKAKPAEAPIALRELEKSDLPRLNAWRNDKTLLDALGNNFLFISSAVDEKWFEQYLKERDRVVRLSIVVKATGDHIGNVNFTAIHPINRSAEFSILIGEASCRGKGYGETATRQMLEHGFRDRGFNRIYLSVLEDNAAALRLYEKTGFKAEGVKRREIFKNGAFHDVVLMSILASEYSGAR